jgi:hypothetical protein
MTSTPAPAPRGWMIRPILWFAAASMAITILHELAHAWAAYLLGVRSILYNYSAHVDLTPAQAATNLAVLIGLAGPTVCLVCGMLSWVAYRRSRHSASALPLLYLAIFGLGTFFGNLMSTSFVGDFSSAAVALHLPVPVRYAVTAIGALAVVSIHFRAGRQLIQTAPLTASRVVAMLGLIIVPVVLGTAAVMLVNQPMPRASVNARVAEASVWIFAGMGAMSGTRHAPDGSGTLELRWADGAVILLAVLAVRLMVRGIPMVP